MIQLIFILIGFACAGFLWDRLHVVNKKCEYYKGRARFFETENDHMNREKEFLIVQITELKNIILDFDETFKF
jgi:hypothetical protein